MPSFLVTKQRNKNPTVGGNKEVFEAREGQIEFFFQFVLLILLDMKLELQQFIFFKMDGKS